MGRSYQANAHAIRRVEADGPTPLAELTDIAGVGIARLVNWIIRGVNGVHLDGIRRAADKKWLSSGQAIQRFKSQAFRHDDDDATVVTHRCRESQSP